MEAAVDEAADDLAQQTPPLWSGLVAGAASGLISRVATFPADTLKARLQLRGAVAGAAAAPGGAAATATAYRTTAAAARHMLATEGLAGFYKGFSAVLWGVVPANLAYFGGYEAGRQLAAAQRWHAFASPLVADMAVGAGAQLLAGLVYTPIDIIKERLQVQPLMGAAYTYASPRAAAAALLRQAGTAAAGGRPLAALGPLFRGYWATNAVWLPWNALYIAGYEDGRRRAMAALACDELAQLPAWAVAGCSAGAAAAAAVATHPFDVVKTRLQVLSAAPGAARLGALQLARRQLAAEGPGSFFHGLTARLLHIAPGCALSWALYEQLKRWLDGG